MKENKPKEGWAGVEGGRKWHYFVDGRSLCRKYGFFGNQSNLEQGNDNSPDNCTECKRKLLKRQQGASRRQGG